MADTLPSHSAFPPHPSHRPYPRRRGKHLRAVLCSTAVRGAVPDDDLDEPGARGVCRGVADPGRVCARIEEQRAQRDARHGV